MSISKAITKTPRDILCKILYDFHCIYVAEQSEPATRVSGFRNENESLSRVRCVWWLGGPRSGVFRLCFLLFRQKNSRRRGALRQLCPREEYFHFPNQIL